MISQNSAKRLGELSKAWFKANKSGDKKAMAAAHAEANQIRKNSGLSEGTEYDKTSGKLTKGYKNKAEKAANAQTNSFQNAVSNMGGGSSPAKNPNEKVYNPNAYDSPSDYAQSVNGKVKASDAGYKATVKVAKAVKGAYKL